MDIKAKIIENVKISIWNAAGLEKYSSITSNYYKGADGIMLVYDITSSTSFQKGIQYLNEAKKYLQDNAIKFLIGNKCDLE